MKKNVFGLGSAPVLVTTVVAGILARFIARQPCPAALIIGNGLALSSTAVVLQRSNSLATIECYCGYGAEQGEKAMLDVIGCYKENTCIIVETFQSLGFNVYGGKNAPYVWAYFPGQSSWDLFGEILEKTHVVTTPGSGFGLGGEASLGLVPLAIGPMRWKHVEDSRSCTSERKWFHLPPTIFSVFYGLVDQVAPIT